MTTTNKTIQSGTTLKARSICDYDCIFEAKILGRSKNTVEVKVMGEVKKCRIKIDMEGNEYIMALGRYSMSPMFKAN